MRNSLLISLVLLSKSVFAFETPTHAFITKRAFDNSNLGQPNSALYFRLGFDRLTATRPFDMQLPLNCVADALPNQDSYVDALPNWLTGASVPPDMASVRFRCPNIYEKRDMPIIYTGRSINSASLVASQILLGPTPELRFESWLMRGVIREDDLAVGNYPTPEDAPDPDPYGVVIDRPRYHFYNPYTNTADVIATLGPALPWALGEADPFLGSGQQLPDPTRGNHYSYLDARRAYFLAITYKQPGISTFDKTRLDSDVRMALWATTLKSIGHVVHLLQDQASPQHSRGERHNHVCSGRFVLINEDIATRTFENYTNYRLTYGYNKVLGFERYIATNSCEEGAWNDMFRAGSDRADMSPTPITAWSANYPIPKFSVQRKFFTTRSPSDPAEVPLALLNARAGLGDYANRGFYTQNNQRGDLPSPPEIADPSFVGGDFGFFNIPDFGSVGRRTYFWPVPDPAGAGFVDAGLVNQRAPIVTRSISSEIAFMIPPLWDGPETLLSLQNYDQMADMLIPRAVAYTAGMIDFFFRGKLEIDPIAQRVFAVMNQGDPHTMNADGYPIRTSNGQIFGFDKIRLRVRNSTDPITESGTNTVVPQTVGTGKLVAVARYHRNPCYKPDLTGERIVDFNNTLTEPNCPQGMRTNYQEISVSAPLTITGNAGLPFGTTIAESVEKIFDFAADPIPVNATDLFIQVVYRGQLGEETDGIAVGIIDTQEPTIVGAWNNTDHYYSNVGFNWLVQNGTNFAHRGIDSLSICSGGGLSSSVLLYRYASPQDGFNISFLNGTLNPGIVRLALINAKFPTPSNQQPYRMVPALNAAPFMQQRSTQSRGQLRQASQEIFTPSVPLPAPVLCESGEPTTTPYWCFDPIKRRRGQPIGNALQPMYFATGAGSNATDVDLPPALPVYSGLRPVVGGTVNFNTDAVLMGCPAPQVQ